MKKVSKLFFVIAIISMLLLSNCSYATETKNALVENTAEANMVIDNTLDELYTSDPNAGIMLINEEDGVMPINEEVGTLYSEEYVESDVFLINTSISYNKNVNGNVYLMGKDIEISSSWINGNVFVMGQHITIRGAISGSVYAMGETVNIETEGVGTVYVLAEYLNLGNNANIVNDLKASADTVNINGNVYRELYIGARSVNVSDTSEYLAKGKVYYSDSCEDASGKLENIQVVKTEDSQEVEEKVKFAITGATIKSQIINIISAVLVIAVIYFIVKNRNIEPEGLSVNSIFKSLGIGLSWLIFTPIVALVLLCTIVGIPLSIILITLYIVALYISVPVASLNLGKLISNKLSQSKSIMIIVISALVYVAVELISIIPIIGGVIKFLVVLYGLETLMKTILSKDKKVEKKEEVVEVVKTDAE